MRRPPRLQEGGTIGVVSPSATITPNAEESLERGIRVLEGLGFRVRLSEHLRAQHFYAAGTREQRLDELHDMWADPDVGLVLMAQGGQSANHLLDGLDHDLLREHPTAFMGMSDATTLLSAISARAGVTTFHGPSLIWGFGRPMAEPVVEHFLDVLVRGRAGPVPSPTLRTVRDGRAAGPLWGGHASILALTMFAGHGPSLADLDGAILLLEGTESVDKLDRTFTALRLAGAFDRIAGLVLGHFQGHEQRDQGQSRTPAEMALEVTATYDFPIVELQEVGHGVDNLTLPIGVPMSIDTAEGVLAIDEPAVS